MTPDPGLLKERMLSRNYSLKNLIKTLIASSPESVVQSGQIWAYYLHK
jgi:hypothetical protein